MRGLSVRAKMLITITGLVALTIVGLFAYHTYEKYEDTEKLMIQENKYFVSTQLPAVVDLLIAGKKEAVQEFVSYLRKQSEKIEFIVISDNNGDIMGSTFGARVPKNLELLIQKASGEVIQEQKFGGRELMLISLPAGVYGRLTIGFKMPTVQEMVMEEIEDALMVIPIFLGLGILVGIFVSARIVKPLRELMKGIEAISKGELEEVDVRSTDEFGQIADVLNTTVERLRGYILTEEQRQEMERNFIKFLEVVSTAAEGDFTQRAPVTADMFGSLADAFNLMVEELSALMKDVRQTAEDVGRETRNLLRTFRKMSEGAENQMVQMKNASAAVDETVVATTEIASKAEEATGAAAEASEAAQRGGALVTRSIEEMNLIRSAVQGINKKMKILSERIMEIGTISGLIGEIASRTNLLAMNASIEAARAGEAGKGFVVIAEEIRSLADRSAQASKEIGNIIKAIQTEAGEITASLEEETEIVEEASRVANQTGQAFRQIQNSIERSTRMINEIYNSSQHQRQVASNMVLAVEAANRISLEFLNYVRDAQSATDTLTKASERLIHAVERFKLPEEGEEQLEEEIGPVIEPAAEEEALGLGSGDFEEKIEEQ